MSDLAKKCADEVRFMEKVVVVENCWEWCGFRSEAGYGGFRYNGAWHKAHRVSYEMFVGPIPSGLVLDHLCRNRGCVNPHHLEPVTRFENNARGTGFGARNLVKTHCPKGHPLDVVARCNMKNSSGTRRYCKTCKAAIALKRRPKKNANARAARAAKRQAALRDLAQSMEVSDD